MCQWRCSIGLFNASFICHASNIRPCECSFYEIMNNIFLYIVNLTVCKLFLSLVNTITLCIMINLAFSLMIIFFPYPNFLRGVMVSSSHPYASYIVYSFLKSIALVNRVRQTTCEHISYFLDNPSSLCLNLSFFLILLQSLLLVSVDIEIQPGPQQDQKKNFSFAFWNLDSLPAREFARIPLIESLQSTYNFDLFGVCESMLTDKISNDEISITGFSSDPFRADKVVGMRNGGVCLYYKESLPIKRRTDLETLPETIVA